MKKIFLTLLTLALISTTALAGPFPQDTFKDLENPDFLGHNLDNWFSGAAQFWKNRNIIKGIEGNFEPDKNVQRAEIVVILKRFNDYLQNPMGEEWDVLKNDFYSVQYPTNAPESRGATKIDDCETGMMGFGDYIWWIKCMDSNEKTALETIQEKNTEGLSQSIETFLLNGYKAHEVTEISETGHVYRYVFVDGGEKFYKITGTNNLVDPSFERFYKSFIIL